MGVGVKLFDVPNYPVGFLVALGVELPVGSGGRTGNVCRQVDKIDGTGVPNIEKRSPARPGRIPGR
jgi:hypothetical protein